MAEKTTKPSSGSVIKFNMAEDEAVRAVSRKGHDIAKSLKTAGIKFIRVIPASSDISMKKQFRLGNHSTHICIEIPYTGVQLDDDLLINDVKTHLLSLVNYKLISEQKYVYSANEHVYRFLLLGDIKLPLPIRNSDQPEPAE